MTEAEKLQKELLETLEALTDGQTALTDRLDAEKVDRKVMEENIGKALEKFNSMNVTEEERIAAKAEADKQLKKVTPLTAKIAQLEDRKFLPAYRDYKVTDDQKLGTTKWMIGFLQRDKEYMDKAVSEHGLTVKTALAEGTVGSGAEVVPEEWIAEILKIAEEQAAYRPRARALTTTRDVVHLAKRNAAPTVTWKAEAAAAGTGGEPTYGQIDVTIFKMLSIYTAATELLEDANVSVIDDLNDQLAEAVAKEEDRMFFEGDVSGLSDVFNGLRFVTGMEELSIGDTVAFTASHLRQTLAKLETRELAGSWWYMHPIELVFLMGLQDSQNRPLWLAGNIQGNAPPTLYGYPYATTDVILRTRMDVVADKSSLYFGNLRHSTIVDRVGTTLAQSIHTKFSTDQVDIRLRKRLGFGVQFASALVRIVSFDTSTNTP
ncbi:hypothetical protein LCGC14_0427650 [marine sediment metagenome]|uniref:Phage capsid-like C-terminal domain-containing protein n=1 Tax=marine sediment metagenome TaxID=412755 RepID=A0A0F9SP43_9ZZZZ